MRVLGVMALFLVLAMLSPLASGATTTFAFEISNSNSNESVFMKQFDAPATALADFDGDGRAELVAHNDNQNVYVLSTKEARVLAEFRTRYPSGWTVRPINDPAVADVDNDGRLDIVVVNSAGYVCVYEYNPDASTSTRFSFTEVWCRRMDTYEGSITGADAGAWVEDVTGDGRAEIFSQTETNGLFAFTHDGSVLWSRGDSGGNAGPTVTDLDADGRKEAVFFGDAGEVRAFDAATGSPKWSFFANRYVSPASIPVSGAVGDLTGDGKKEVVFIARQAIHTDDYRRNHFMMFVLRHDGLLYWSVQPTWGNPLSYTHPIIHDVTGDGKPEILAQDWNTIGHKPGNWEQLGPANVFAYTAEGTLLWRTPLDNTWSNDDLGLADFDGDGALEVLAYGWSGSSDAFSYLDARTGAKEATFHTPGWVILRGPVVGDFDKSGDLEFAIPVHDTPRGGAFRIYDTNGAPCTVAFGGWQNLHPCAPLTGRPTGGGGGGDGNNTIPPPPPEDFTATFRTNGGNQWWVEVYVDASKTLAGVDARANGGAWVSLEKKSWGSWAKSFYVAPGSIVEFQARAASGESVVSGKYTWPSGTPTTDGGGSGGGDGGSGGGTSFEATFRNVRGNEWWVETDVTANKALATVEARVDAGPWIALEKKSWGSWAKSIRAPAGSLVQFRATATTGETGLSQAYRWPPA